MTDVNCMEFLYKSIISYLQLIRSHQNNQVFAHVCTCIPNLFDILIFNSVNQFFTAQEIKEFLGTFVDHLNRRGNLDGEQSEIDKFRKSIEDINTELSQKFEVLALNKTK